MACSTTSSPSCNRAKRSAAGYRLYDEEGIGRVSAAIGRLSAYCREHGIRLILANQPELRMPADYPFAKVDTMIERRESATIVRSIVNAHHGSIDAQANADGGLTVVVRLPQPDARRS